MTFTRISQIGLGLIFFLIFTFNFSLLFQPMIAEADAYSRALISKRQIENGILIDFKNPFVWLPLHFTAIGIPQLIGFEAYESQKIITLIFSWLSIYGLYLYTKEAFSDKKVALISALLFTLFPMRIFMSTQTLSEGTFLCFLIFALYYLIKKNHQTWDYFLFFVFINIAHGIRYESWYLLPVIFTYIFLNHDFDKKDKLRLFFSSFFFPVFWCFNNWLIHHNPFAFFDQKYEMAKKTFIPEYFNANASFEAWISRLLRIFPPLALFFSLFNYKMFSKKQTKEKVFAAVLPLYLFFLLVIQVFLGTMEWFPLRYLIIPTIFFLPFLANQILNFCYFFKKNISEKRDWLKKILLIGATTTLSISVICNYRYIYYKTNLYLNDQSFLKSNYDDTHRIQNTVIYQNFLKILEVIDRVKPDFIHYYYNNGQRLWLENAFFYFSKVEGIEYEKSELPKKYREIEKDNALIIWERETDGVEPPFLEQFTIIFANENFYIILCRPS